MASDNVRYDRYGPPPDAERPPSPGRPRRRPKVTAPQDAVNQFWNGFNTKYPGKVFNVLPNNPHARKKAAEARHGVVHGQRWAKSYDEARDECVRDVERIKNECKRLNQKYRDPHFDIEWDLKSGQRNCLDGLSRFSPDMKPKGVKRVTDIFEKPQFYVNGPTAGDVRQGRDGDCYFMAALCGLGNMEGLIERVCVAREEKVGVYGFVFYRDGEWQQTIVDDKLYLRAPDYDEAIEEREVWDDINRIDGEEEYRKAHQTGSRALYFAQCQDENETWLPLLEKAYAKAHGDYSSIDGGFTGEAIEDLTGGVTSELYSTDILDKDEFWKNELMQVNESFLFGCATGFYSNWLDTTGNNSPRERQGIAEGHAYSIMEAVEVKGEKLLKVRNPWGKKEWQGKWSDGSEQWDAEWMTLLKHKFGNDGIFWISYDDLLKKYQHFDRTRIFKQGWNVTQCWTNVHVPWSAEYLSSTFQLELKERSKVVIVLSQLDDTYFGGLEGPYRFDLQFRLEDANNNDENDYIVRSNGNYAMARSVSTDIELEAGTYTVLMKITATRDNTKDSPEDLLPTYAATRREKLISMGISYDLAHAKGVLVETMEEKTERLAREKSKRAKDRDALKQQLKKQAEKGWRKRKAEHERGKKRMEKMDRVNNARKASRNPDGNLWRTGTFSSADGSMDVAVDGSVDVKNSKPANQDAGNDQKVMDEVAIEDRKEQKELPTSLRSFSGEEFSMGGDVAKAQATTTEVPDQPSLPAAGIAGAMSPAQSQHALADSVVSSLDEVIKVADTESEANKVSGTTEELQIVENVVEQPPTPTVQLNGKEVVTDVKPLPIRPPLSQPAHRTSDHPSDVAQVENSQPQAVNNKPQRHHQRNGAIHQSVDSFSEGRPTPPPCPRAQEDPPSDTDSFPDFDWQTDLDMSSEEETDDDDRSRAPPPPSKVVPPPPVDSPADGDGADETWNAVCVVGLRVYSLLKNDQVTLKVIKPQVDEQADDKNKDKSLTKNVTEVKIDPDDMNKGAVTAEPQCTGTPVDDDVA